MNIDKSQLICTSCPYDVCLHLHDNDNAPTRDRRTPTLMHKLTIITAHSYHLNSTCTYVGMHSLASVMMHSSVFILLEGYSQLYTNDIQAEGGALK